MKTKVWFMGIYEDRLLFPTEVPPNYYCPSVFIIAVNKGEQFRPSYQFDACVRGEIQTLNLVFNDNFFTNSLTGQFRIDLIGHNILFNAVKSKYKYLGQSQQLFDGKDLYELNALQPKLLETIALLNNTYLVGDSIAFERGFQ